MLYKETIVRLGARSPITWETLASSTTQLTYCWCLHNNAYSNELLSPGRNLSLPIGALSHDTHSPSINNKISWLFFWLWAFICREEGPLFAVSNWSSCFIILSANCLFLLKCVSQHIEFVILFDTIFFNSIVDLMTDVFIV